MTSGQPLVGWRVAVLAVLMGCCGGRYIITTPHEWVLGESAQVCVEVDDPSSPSGFLTVSVSRTTRRRKTEEVVSIVPNTTVTIPAGSAHFCTNVAVPRKDQFSGTLWMRGQVAGNFVNRTMGLSLRIGLMQKTFIQTDKYLYQPGQKVQIRILTMHLNNLTVDTFQHPDVWITTPSKTRIAQWSNVDNSAGLVHLEMTLADEPEQGRYEVHVKGQKGTTTHREHFQVREYTVPRFEVIITTPQQFIPTESTFSVKVCARYTFGQPVHGNVTLEINNQSPTACYVSKNMSSHINGCMDFAITASTFRTIDCQVYVFGLKALVTESGTEVTLQGKTKLQVFRQSITFKKVYEDNFKKPGLPYHVKVKVERPDGTPARDVPIEMCRGDICSNITVPSDGMIVTAAGRNTFRRIRMKALNTRVMLRESSFTTFIEQYFSPSNSSLHIYVPKGKLNCTDGMLASEYLLPVFFVSDQARAAFTVQVISKRYVQYYTKTDEYELTPAELPISPEDQVEPLEEPPPGTKRGVVYIPISLNNSISLSARVVVWMVRPDGEMVTDVKDLEIEKCLPNTAELAWSRDLAEPGQEVEMRLTSAPNSLCSLGVVDKGTMLLDTRTTTLTIQNIFRPLEYSLLRPGYHSTVDIVKYCRAKLGDDNYRYHSKYQDAYELLVKAGFHILSDLMLKTTPCEVSSEFGFVDTTGIIGIRSGGDNNNRIHSSFGSTSQGGTQKKGRTRSHFPETWLWDLYVLPASGIHSERITLPDTITEWVGQAVCVHPQKGLGLSQVTNITTFTPFFLDLTLPPSIKRGETLAVLISIYNYMEISLPVVIQVNKSPDYEILQHPSNHGPEGVLKACVEGNSKVVVEVKIKPSSLGEVDISVAAMVDQQPGNECGTSTVDITRSDAAVKSISVKPEGFLREEIWNKYICTKDLADKSDSLGPWDVIAPQGIVEGSARGWVTVMGSLLTLSLKNLGRLITMPSGCGEQNMVNFAPNVFILQYLTTTRQDTPEITTKLIGHMNTGYQRQLLYLRKSGSYSAFGNADSSGSNWLTAFVIKSFAQAQPFISIDTASLRRSLDWLLGTQADDGCFNSVGQVFSKALKGGVGGRGREALTAYVLASLLEAEEDPMTSALVNATSCLLNLPSPSQHPYNLALKAYALALMAMPEAHDTLKSLMAQAVVTSNSTYWDLQLETGRSKSLLVETASYATLAMLTADAQTYRESIRKVVKWITAQRNGRGGFYTTQDTVAALQALAKYESSQYQGQVDVVATVLGGGINHSFDVNENNKLVTQRVSLQTLPTSLTFNMEGKGCAVFQSVLRYNVYEPEASDTFSLTVTTQTAADKSCVTKWINTCATYLLSGENSNMAVISVELVSGYVPLKEDLKNIIKNNPGVIKRYEVKDDQVSFYIEEFSEGQEVCVRMRMTRLVEVDDARPGSVTVYDYYQPEFSVSKIYRLPRNDECVYSP